jgi:hypothetical protein
MRNLPLRRRLVAVAVPLLLPFPLLAQTGPSDAAPIAPARSAFAQPVDPDLLSTLRGGREVTHNDMRLDGITAGNVADHVATGANTIAGGAFSGMSGLPLVVQNSGANVLIQNAVIVNVKMQ